MKYTVDIQGMHCDGCRSLVALSLEEENLRAIRVDLEKASASFESDETLSAVQARIDRIASELSGYQFAALREVQ